MSNYPGGPSPIAAPSTAPAASSAAPSVTAAPAALSQALAPPGAPVPETILSQGVEREGAADATQGETLPAYEANPWKFSATLESHLVSVDVAPGVAKFFGGRITEALQRPAPTAEHLAAGVDEAGASLQQQFGDDAEAIGHLAREEVKLMARDFPDLVPLLERTGLGNDVQVIKAFAGRAHDRLMAQQRTKFGLPPRR